MFASIDYAFASLTLSTLSNTDVSCVVCVGGLLVKHIVLHHPIVLNPCNIFCLVCCYEALYHTLKGQEFGAVLVNVIN